MKNYYRIMLGRGSAHAEEAYNGNFIGADYGLKKDLTEDLIDDRREFNHKFIPIYLAANPDKTKMGAALACGMLWTIAKGIQAGDVILCPDGKGSYYSGEIVGEYSYHPGSVLPHRRSVSWYPKKIARNDMSESLKNSTGSIGSVSDVSQYAEEIERLLSGIPSQVITTTDPTVEDASEFALEKHLEDFLVQNWKSTELGKRYDIYEEESGDNAGQQYPSDTGPIDILAISKDKKTLLVVELKKGRVSDVVVGQIQRYMGFVKAELAEEGQEVKGVIIGFEDDVRIRRALSVAQGIEFYTYKVQFSLEKK